MFRTVVGAYRDAFAGLPRRVWLLSAVTLIHRSGTMVLPFLTIYLTTQRDMSVRMAGLFLALYGLGSAMGAVFSGRLAERIGNVRTMQITLVGASAGFFTLGMVTGPSAMALVLFVTSIAAEGFRTPSSADLGLSASAATRSRAFALRRLAINLGMAIGPAAGGLLATVDYRWLFAADGATCLLAALAVTLWLAPRRPASRPVDAKPVDAQPAVAGPMGAGRPAESLWHDRVFVAVLGCTVVMNLAFAQLFGTYPLTLYQDFAYSEAVVGGILALNTVLIVIFEMVLVHRLNGHRPLAVAAVGCLALAVGFALVPYDPRVVFALVALAVITVGEMLSHPMIEGFVAGRVREASMGRAMGILTAAFSLTFVVAPIIGTAVYDLFGYRILWLGTAAICLAAAIGFAWVDARTRLPTVARRG